MRLRMIRCRLNRKCETSLKMVDIDFLDCYVQLALEFKSSSSLKRQVAGLQTIAMFGNAGAYPAWVGKLGDYTGNAAVPVEEADYSAFGTDTLTKKKNVLTTVLRPDMAKKKPHLVIGMPSDFRPVSSIIDVDILPETHRRVRLYKHGMERPLGFYIRDGSSVRVTPHGLEKVPGIFISRLVPGGLAQSTGLLAVNDEVLEVNGIEVSGKSLDQVTDMMIANSHNLIITVRPANQRNNVVRNSRNSGSSGQSTDSSTSMYSNAPPQQIIQNYHPEEAQSDDEDIIIEEGGTSVIPRAAPSTESLESLTQHSSYHDSPQNGFVSSTYHTHLSASSGSLDHIDHNHHTKILEEDGTIITL
ncbi:unnamed protein product [Ranitomeya imitator]|uniref:PDZ domain-containing protein n=1 Tax=Ranitomeya imitator TaxID=111125 RepID=A0ABN9LGZ7_9NEOB|nr:unnamed protein product [Ranitomeya imitator]